jgi:hypothetical protein
MRATIKRAPTLPRWLLFVLVLAILAVGAAVASGSVRLENQSSTVAASVPLAAVTAAVAPTATTVAASGLAAVPVATAVPTTSAIGTAEPTAVPTLTEQEKAAAYLEQETHEQDYCQCSQSQTQP